MEVGPKLWGPDDKNSVIFRLEPQIWNSQRLSPDDLRLPDGSYGVNCFVMNVLFISMLVNFC